MNHPHVIQLHQVRYPLPYPRSSKLTTHSTSSWTTPPTENSSTKSSPTSGNTHPNYPPRLKEPDARKYFHQLLKAVRYIHSLHIVHRDLKPENLLLNKNKDLLIADFGLSNRYDTTLSTACGSPCYAAPEMILQHPYQGTTHCT